MRCRLIGICGECSAASRIASAIRRGISFVYRVIRRNLSEEDVWQGLTKSEEGSMLGFQMRMSCICVWNFGVQREKYGKRRSTRVQGAGKGTAEASLRRWMRKLSRM